MRIFKLAAAAILCVFARPGQGLADTLKVGQAFPEIQLSLVTDDQPPSLATWSDVARDKAIVFIFASW